MTEEPVNRVHLTEQSEYDARWASAESGESAYSAKDIGYTPHFLRFMEAGLGQLKSQTRPPSNPHSPVRALEVGCGDGFFTAQLAERACDATGVDLSPVGIESARKHYPNCTFLVHDLTKALPFEDATF